MNIKQTKPDFSTWTVEELLEWLPKVLFNGMHTYLLHKGFYTFDSNYEYSFIDIHKFDFSLEKKIIKEGTLIELANWIYDNGCKK